MDLTPLPPLTAKWINDDGSPSLVWRQYLVSVDKLLRTLAGASLGTLTSAANDAAAGAAGVPIGGLYQTSGTVKIRLV
jgi:hypothetical protein